MKWYFKINGPGIDICRCWDDDNDIMYVLQHDTKKFRPNQGKLHSNGFYTLGEYIATNKAGWRHNSCKFNIMTLDDLFLELL